MMEIAFVIVGVGGFIVFIFQRQARLVRRSSWRQLEDKLEGTFHEKECWHGLSQDVGEMSFRRDGFAFKLSTRIARIGNRTEYYTQLRTTVNQPFYLDISKSFGKALFSSMMKDRPIETKYAEYDKRFHVRSSNALWARFLLSSCDAWRKYQLESRAPVTLHFEDRSLVIEAHAVLDKFEELDAFVSFASLAAKHIDNTEPPASANAGQLSLARSGRSEGALTIAKSRAGDLSTPHQD